MLRVEASNLPKSYRAPRPRRLLPNPPLPRRPAPSRFEIIPPHDAASAPTTELAVPRSSPHPGLERWSVKLELGDDEIAKLYGQGMTRGAVVWKKGMVEWRPLLITPELSGLLRRTRITVNDPPQTSLALPQYPSAPSLVDDVTLPRPARVPFDVGDASEDRVPISTVAPTALDVEAPTRSKSRQPLELAAVAAAAFALAWLGHARLHPEAKSAALASVAAVAAPVAASTCAPLPNVSTVLASSSIPTVSIADLPLMGAKSAASVELRGRASRGSSRPARSSSDGPSRSELVGALSRVAGAASGCGERGGPVRVVVTFANSGVARSIQVSGADLPAPTRSCIIGAASRARIPAFSGEPVTVAKTL